MYAYSNIYLLFLVGDDRETSECVPLLSEYTDCSEANICTGCSRCSCTLEGRWSCETVQDCPRTVDEDLYDVDTISNAYEMLVNELEDKDSPKAVELPAPTEKNRLLGIDEDVKLENELRHLMYRVKRSVKNKSETKPKNNGTVKFYHTVDELNEDTLKNTTISGTIEAKKVVGAEVSKISRRTSSVDSKNITGINDLHIQYNQPKDYDHINDNKIDSSSNISDKLNSPNHDKIKDLLGNYSQNAKDKDLSKIVVNELKTGSEVIGDKLSTPVSNITFTPENDTLTAMAFIAGNLLSRLWKIEKDASVESIETDVLKHEKISDLINLFKEPLTMRQEAFIKTALERLAQVVSKENKVKNISLCETLASSEDLLKKISNVKDKDDGEVHIKCKDKKSDKKQGNATIEAITKINNVLNLISKYETTQRKLFDLKNETAAITIDNENNDSTFTEDEGKSLNVFGNLLHKITNLILPKRTKINKKIKSRISRLNIFDDSQGVLKTLKDISGFDIGNMTLTYKDKLIMDYLNILKMNPECSNRISQVDVTGAFPNAHGDLMNNLSKLLILNSYKELMKSILPESQESNKSLNKSKNIKNVVNADKNRSMGNVMNNSESNSLTLAKERLQQHINLILEDLVEIENSNGFPMQSNISNILPCIHKFINDGKNKVQDSERRSKQYDFEKITTMFESLKNSIRHNLPTRRSEMTSVVTPKSSQVWERVIKNLNKKMKETRRINGGLPQQIENDLNSFTKLKQMINNLDLSGSSYKKYIDLANVPVASHLIFLKALHASVKEISVTLKNIKMFVETVMDPSAEQHYEIQKFVEDSARIINLDEKIFEKLKHSPRNNDFINRSRFEVKDTSIYKGPIKWAERGGVNDNFKLTREQILIQLIRNRIQLYLRLKEAKSTKLAHDVNYNVARRIMTQLASGNFSLAKELFSLFLDNSGKIKNRKSLHNNFEVAPTAIPEPKKNPSDSVSSFMPNNQNRMSDREVLMQESFLKQLMRLKTMNV